jgi:hypothetical protein
MIRTPHLFLISLALLLAPATAAPAQETDKAQQVFQSLYGEEVKRVAATRDRTDDVELAQRLLAAARKADATPDLQALLCENACQLGAADPRGYDAVFDAADLLAGKCPDRAGACQEIVLGVRKRQFESGPEEWRATVGELLIQCLLQTAEARARAGDVAEAMTRCRMAQEVARKIRMTDTEAISAQMRQVAERQRILAKAATLKAQVKSDPANAAARDQLVRLLVAELDNPAEAAAYVAESSDAALRKFVPAAAKPVDQAPEIAALELADWYRGLAEGAGAVGKPALLLRAKAYYERYLDIHPSRDADRTMAELALQKATGDLEKALPASKTGHATPGIGQWVDLFRLIDPVRDCVEGKAEMTDKGLAFRVWGENGVLVPLAPAGSYELEFQFVRTGEIVNGIFACLPVGTNRVTLWLHQYKLPSHGFESINGKKAKDNGTLVTREIEQGRPHTVRARVLVSGTLASIAVDLDGAPLTAWSGPQSALAPGSAPAGANPRCPALGLTYSSAFFSSARLRMLAGKAVLLRPTDSSAATPAAPAKP